MHLHHHWMANISLAGCTACVLMAMPTLFSASVFAQVPEMGGAQSAGHADGASPQGTSTGAAGSSPAQGGAPTGAPEHKGRWFEPRITIQHTVTSNGPLTSGGGSDQVTEVMPGFSVIRDSARVKGFADYTLHGTHYARGTSSDKVWHNLNARGTVEAIDNHLYIDIDGMLGLQPVSAFGPTGTSLANSNMAKTSSFRVSPYIRGEFVNGVDYEVRYGLQEFRSDTASNSNVTINDWRLHLGKVPRGQLFGWGLDATQEDADYSNGRNIDTTALRGRLTYLPVATLSVTGIVGVESTNQLSPEKKSHRITGFAIDWRPSERSRLFVERQSRYFGESHNASLEYRTARTVWRYTDQKDVMSGLGVQSASMGSLFDLLDGFYAGLEPNPILRMRIIQAELARLGLPPDTKIFQDFLSSSSRLQRSQNLSLALLGRRSTLTLAALRSDTRQMDGSLSLGDDFQNNQRIRQRGWSAIIGHRLTPNTTVNAMVSGTRSIGSTLGWEMKTRMFQLGMNTLVAPRTSLGLQLRRVLSDGNVSNYDESAVMAFITHRF